ncbi:MULTISPECIES: hypothetical protein [unclassified Janthinobacterium]|uniref:hypothetical protein n=1 Tax=unclassified Janthinobacterium TaxID=2610881 RepID=UPI00160C6BFF|nr:MULTISPECIES: hypothetical protein [unclassified Janthinobacterium]MBB5608434.1 hypothetical protein [Janthinobacterium sp. S3T4]MBB5613600.1 hypothetical protein [Janthinobacterium sp. S3M3]
MFCTACGTRRQQDDAPFCAHCGAGFHSGANPAAQHRSTPGALPDGIAGWSWGAFLLNWVWAIGNRTWIGLFSLLPYVGFGFAIWLGIKGREMAWKNGQWQSVEHFNRVQKKWSQWGIGISIAFGMISMLFLLLIIFHISSTSDSEDMSDKVATVIASAAGQQEAELDQCPVPEAE